MERKPRIARHRPTAGRVLRRAAVLGGLGVGLLAGVASAASVVQVRVGRHPTFTRVVFELDAPAGYRVSREAAAEGPRAILVTLEASSEPRQIASKSVVVESVAVEQGVGQALARIALRRSTPQVREMILADPPRIVFDVMLGEGALAAAGTAAPTAAAEPTPTSPVPPAPPAEAPAEEAAVAEAPAVSPAEPAEAPAKPEPAEPQPVETEKTVEPVEEAPAPEAPAPQEKRLAEPSPLPSAALPPREQARAPRAPSPAPTRPAAPAPAVEAPFDLATVGALAAGVLALIVIAVLLVRRRAIPNDLDAAAFEDDEDEEGDAIPAEGFSMEEEPSAVGDAEEPIAAEAPLEEVDVRTEPGLFDETAKGEGEMDQEMENLPISRSEPIAAPEPAVTGATGVDSEVTRLVRELERRIEHLEARLDESVDARERLERQVAAQSEELRVQRAAIARTQRALRSLSRSEDDQVTEPAIREPGS